MCISCCFGTHVGEFVSSGSEERRDIAQYWVLRLNIWWQTRFTFAWLGHISKMGWIEKQIQTQEVNWDCKSAAENTNWCRIISEGAAESCTSLYINQSLINRKYASSFSGKWKREIKWSPRVFTACYVSSSVLSWEKSGYWMKLFVPQQGYRMCHKFRSYVAQMWDCVTYQLVECLKLFFPWNKGKSLVN